MADEISVAPSEENGNVPLDTPSEETPAIPALPGGEDAPVAEETPAGDEAPAVEGEEVPVVEETPAVDELFELPDGRKVDAATLQTEWKDNFAPEYTRKAQELADLKKENLPVSIAIPMGSIIRSFADTKAKKVPKPQLAADVILALKIAKNRQPAGLERPIRST